MNINKSLEKLFKYVSYVLAFLLLAHLGFLIYVVDSLEHPPRRYLQSYHLEWLDNPKNHGMEIIEKKCVDGKVPCLLVSPNPYNIGKRGITTQHQLKKQGFTDTQLNKQNGIVVLLHGRGGRKEDLLPIAERFVASGFYCVLPDLPAHGLSPVHRSQFANAPFEKELASNVLNDARTMLNKPKLPAYLWGMSMGGAYANANMSMHEEQWQAMVIVSSFDTLENVLKKRIEFLPNGIQNFYLKTVISFAKTVDAIEIEKSQPITWAKHITKPVLVIHGSADTIIDVRQGKALFTSYASKDKKWLSIPNANHNNVLVTNYPVYSEMVGWFLRH